MKWIFIIFLFPSFAFANVSLSGSATLEGNVFINSGFSLIPSTSGRTWAYSFHGTNQGGVTGYGMNLPNLGNAPSLMNSLYANAIGVLEWPTGQTNYYAWASFVLPPGYQTNGAISYSIEYRSTDSVNAAILYPSIACSGTSSPLDNPTFGSASPISLVANSGLDQTFSNGSWTPGAGAIPSCSAGQRIWVKTIVDTNTNGMTYPFDLINLVISVQGNL